jgi:ketosteroid isomerase-like protein
MKKYKILFVIHAFFMTPLVFFSCNTNTVSTIKSPSADEIINADKAFSDMSRQVGMKKAFLEYIDNNGVLLRPNHLPIVGADAIDYLSQSNDTDYTLSWKPAKAEIAQSGDLGFSYGVYEFTTKDTTLKGTYVSIWKKQKDGDWKFVLDCGNEGISQEP